MLDPKTQAFDAAQSKHTRLIRRCERAFIIRWWKWASNAAQACLDQLGCALPPAYARETA